MKLTKKTIEKLNSAPIDVRLYNGNFNRASVKVKNNKVEYELIVEDTHPILRLFSICKEPETTFVVWGTPYQGIHEEMPECLKDLEQRLLDATEMSDDEARKIHGIMVALTSEFYNEMGWCA